MFRNMDFNFHVFDHGPGRDLIRVSTQCLRGKEHPNGRVGNQVGNQVVFRNMNCNFQLYYLDPGREPLPNVMRGNEHPNSGR